MDEWIDLAALGRVLLASLVGGAGLVAVFSLGLVGLSEHEGRMRSGTHAGRGGSPLGLAVASGCFLCVAAGVAVGLWAMLKG
ncbi:hypothetical protein [Motilibacter deserti]|uniref:DUF4190 domain-containing protein n=1 Tax=Motilibacter deserti TaxID=2714956 RepID=A0ABX0GVL9_9ACTN|nr:hypothetical protein [Motilibacter deserti]NHC14842.1 hypothetical protein [Motilibacter deserti]